MVAVYAGSFDPVTRGHLSVVDRALSLFDRVHCLVADNPNKQYLFDREQRSALLQRSLPARPGVVVAATAGYVVDYARKHEIRFLIRGVRNVADARYEADMAAVNARLAPDVCTILVPADPLLADVSSSQLRALARRGAELDRWCTPVVARALQAAYGVESSHHARHGAAK